MTNLSLCEEFRNKRCRHGYSDASYVVAECGMSNAVVITSYKA
jgi:hypothetical protein